VEAELSLVPVDRQEAQAATDRLAVKTGTDLSDHPAETGRRVPGLDWSVGETGAHLVTLIDDMTAYATGEHLPVGTTEEIPALNRRRIDLLPDRHGEVLEGLLLDAVAGFAQATAGMDTGLSPGTTTERSTSPPPSRCSSVSCRSTGLTSPGGYRSRMQLRR
jgi:hypothetical protein